MLRNYNRKVCMLGIFFACFCVSIVNGQTVSTVDVSGVDLGSKDYVTTRQFSGSNGIAWTANRDLWVSQVFYVSGEFPYSYGTSTKFLAIPNKDGENEQVLLTSCWLQNIKSITFLIARTGVYEESNKVCIDTASCVNGVLVKDAIWTMCYRVDVIEKYIDSYFMAESMRDAGYSETQYDRVTYTFDTPYSGYIRLRIDNPHTTQRNTLCPYFVIPELTVVHNAPVPCTSCFSVTIR